MKWIRKNVIKAKIANLNLSMKPIDISTGFVLDILTKDDPQSIQMRKNFNRKKLTAESLLDLISAATLFSRVPAALKTAPIIAKIYKPGFKKIFTELESFNRKEYTQIAHNIIQLSLGKKIDIDSSPKKIIKTPDRPRPDPIDCTKLSNRPVRCSISKCSVSINSNFNFDCQSQSGHTKIEKRQIVSIVDKIIKSDKGVKLVRKIDPKYKIGTSNSIFDNDSITYINHNINIRGIAQKNADTSKLKLNVLNVLLVTLKTIHSRLRKNLNNKTMNHNTKIAYKAINSVAKLYNLFAVFIKKLQNNK